MSMVRLYSHSGGEYYLSDHLEQTYLKFKAKCKEKGLKLHDDMFFGVLIHDIGKATTNFQNLLKRRTDEAMRDREHPIYGALLLYKLTKNFFASYFILMHHGISKAVKQKVFGSLENPYLHIFSRYHASFKSILTNLVNEDGLATLRVIESHSEYTIEDIKSAISELTEEKAVSAVWKEFRATYNTLKLDKLINKVDDCIKLYLELFRKADTKPETKQ